MAAQSSIIGLQAKDVSQSIFEITEYVLSGQSEKEQKLNHQVSKVREIQKMVFAHGDSQMLNAALFENYLTMTGYYDDDFEKTAAFADLMSLDEVNEAYIGRT